MLGEARLLFIVGWRNVMLLLADPAEIAVASVTIVCSRVLFSPEDMAVLLFLELPDSPNEVKLAGYVEAKEVTFF